MTKTKGSKAGPCIYSFHELSLSCPSSPRSIPCLPAPICHFVCSWKCYANLTTYRENSDYWVTTTELEKSSNILLFPMKRPLGDLSICVCTLPEYWIRPVSHVACTVSAKGPRRGCLMNSRSPVHRMLLTAPLGMGVCCLDHSVWANVRHAELTVAPFWILASRFIGYSLK